MEKRDTRVRREFPYRDKRSTLLKSKIYTSYYAYISKKKGAKGQEQYPFKIKDLYKLLVSLPYISLKEGIQNAHRNKLLNEEIRIGRSFSTRSKGYSLGCINLRFYNKVVQSTYPFRKKP